MFLGEIGKRKACKGTFRFSSFSVFQVVLLLREKEAVQKNKRGLGFENLYCSFSVNLTDGTPISVSKK